ncbi:MAG: penicillin-binding protein 2 [Deferrisomatales bacterium]
MISVRTSRSALKRRFLGCVLVVAATFGVLTARLFYLQVLHGATYRYLSENNRIRLERIRPPRGMILDRNGEILADVRASFDALVVPAEVPRERREEIYGELMRLLEVPRDELAAAVEGPGPPPWKPRLLKRRLLWTEMARLEAHRLELPGVLVQATPVRHYPFGALLGQSLGYVGEISPRELGQPAFAEYESGDFLGRTGLEWAFEGVLRGQPGGQQVEVDVRGRRLGVLAAQPPRPGRNIVLTVDRRLQQAAAEALGEQTGAVVALDVHTGDVLAMASRPSFDPNHLAAGIRPEEWQALATDPRHPLQHRCVQGQYPPGSTFKIVTALAGLAEGVVTPATRVFCSGAFLFAGRPYRCWKKAGHGWVDLRRALVESCDVYFYQLGLDLGVDGIHKYAQALGLGRPTGIDLPGEKPGLAPSKAWKRRARKEPWYAGETLSVAIGQGYVLATPLQLASMIAAVAHPHGAQMRPRIVSRIEDARGRPVEEIPPIETRRLPFRRVHLDRVRDALEEVVSGPHGTGKRARIDGYPVAGKTGTAQVVKLPTERSLPEEQIPWEHRDHALFLCYAPADEPEIAVAVVVEHGGHGGAAAAPVARRVIEAYRELKLSGLFSARSQP